MKAFTKKAEKCVVPMCLEDTMKRWPKPLQMPKIDNVGLFLATRLMQVGVTGGPHASPPSSPPVRAALFW